MMSVLSLLKRSWLLCVLTKGGQTERVMGREEDRRESGDWGKGLTGEKSSPLSYHLGLDVLVML